MGGGGVGVKRRVVGLDGGQVHGFVGFRACFFFFVSDIDDRPILLNALDFNNDWKLCWSMFFNYGKVLLELEPSAGPSISFNLD